MQINFYVDLTTSFTKATVSFNKLSASNEILLLSFLMCFFFNCTMMVIQRNNHKKYPWFFQVFKGNTFNIILPIQIFVMSFLDILPLLKFLPFIENRYFFHVIYPP